MSRPFAERITFVPLKLLRKKNVIIFSRRRDLALLKAEPGKNWNSFETFIFVTLNGLVIRSTRIPGVKIGKALFEAISRWPTPKITKIKNKHNFGIINPMKLISVSNFMFLSMIYSHVHLKLPSDITWPGIEYGRHPKEPKSRTSITVISLSLKGWSWRVIPWFWVWSIHLCT